MVRPGVSSRVRPLALGRHSSIRLSALDSSPFRHFLGASFFGSLGGWIGGTAQGWLVLDLTGSAGALGWASAAGWLPFLVASPIAGVLADRIVVNRIVIWSRTAIVLAAAILAILTTIRAIALWQVVALAFLAGCAYALSAPALQATLGSYVRPRDIGAAVALNSAQFNLARIVGPPIAGLAVGGAGIGFSLWCSATCAVLALLAFRGLPQVHRQRSAVNSMFRDMADGVAWLRDRRELLAVVLLTGAPALLALNYGVLLPVFARDQLALDAAGLGALSATAGVGALLGALVVATVRPGGGSGRLMVSSLGVMSIGVLVFSLSTSFVLSLVALGVVGATQVAYFNTASSLLQLHVPGDMLGRVLSLYAVVAQGLIPLGNVAIGEAADVISPRLALAAAAALCLAITGVTGLLVPELAALEGRIPEDA